MPTTGAAAAGTATTANASLADCPFSGTVEPTQSTGQPNAVVAIVQASKSGCIDNITFQFATLPPSWTATYASGPFVDVTGKIIPAPGPSTLVLTFLATTYANNQMPATIQSDALDTSPTSGSRPDRTARCSTYQPRPAVAVRDVGLPGPLQHGARVG